MVRAWPDSLDEVFSVDDSVHAYFSEFDFNPSRFLDCGERYQIFGPRCCCQCDDPRWTFSNYFSLWECALYPNVTNSARLGTLPKNDSILLVNYHADTGLAKAANVTSMITACLVGYCNTLDICKEKNHDACSETALSINGSMLSTAAMDSCLLHICTSHPAPLVNADFVGIGTISSYLLGVGLSLLSAVILTILMVRLKRKTEPANAEISTATTMASPGSHCRRTRFEADFEGKKFTAQRLHDAMVAALVEFLKTQCFLVMASSVAATFWYDTQYTSFLDDLGLFTVANISIFPVTFTFYILATFNSTRKSRYLYSLSLCTWIFGFYTAFSLQISYENERDASDDDEYLQEDSYDEFPWACHQWTPYNICPTQFPGAILLDLSLGNSFYGVLCLPVIFGLTIWQLSPIPRIAALLASVRGRNPKNYPWLPPAIMHIVAIGLLGAPLYFSVKDVYSLFQTESVNMTWGFGQIVAIAAYIPFVAGLINNYVDGVGDAHTKQLPRRYGTTAVT